MTAHGDDKAGPSLPDPETAAARQLARDRDITSWKPELLERKHARMKASAFAYLRGSNPLFYELLAASPDLADGPGGEGWLVGDLHLENFGAFRVEPLGEAPEVVFDLNDFDDAFQGPWRWDVLRLLTSVLLAARDHGLDGSAAVGAARTLVASYARALESRRLPHPPALVARLVAKISERKRVQFLDARTKVVGDKRRFVRGDRYLDLPAATVKQLPRALASFIPADGGPRPSDAFFEIVDAAFRVAGTGSLGCRRYAILIEAKGSPDGNAIFDLKEEWPPAAEAAGVTIDLAPNIRVVTAQRTCVARPPFMLGTTTFDGRPMIGRRLMPQEDKLDASALDADELDSVAGYFGALTALAHRRGSTQPNPGAWSPRACEDMVRRATLVAGWHEAVYLAFCRAL
jgi:uncharacterized protein (DUF2252 family)